MSLTARLLGFALCLLLSWFAASVGAVSWYVAPHIVNVLSWPIWAGGGIAYLFSGVWFVAALAALFVTRKTSPRLAGT